jgi:hypothetical protein
MAGNTKGELSTHIDNLEAKMDPSGKILIGSDEKENLKGFFAKMNLQDEKLQNKLGKNKMFKLIVILINNVGRESKENWCTTRRTTLQTFLEKNSGTSVMKFLLVDPEGNSCVAC